MCESSGDQTSAAVPWPSADQMPDRRSDRGADSCVALLADVLGIARSILHAPRDF